MWHQSVETVEGFFDCIEKVGTEDPNLLINMVGLK